MQAAKERSWDELEQQLDTLHATRTSKTLASSNTTARYPIHTSKWLEKTAWPAYLEEQDLQAVACLLAYPSSTEPGLKALLQAFDELIDQSRQSILDEEINVFALHRVNSFVPSRPYRKPLHTKLLETTYKRYKKDWHQLLIYVYRLTVLEQGPDLHYVLTNAQQQALHQISTANSRSSQPQLATQRLARPSTPINNVMQPYSSSPPALLPRSVGLDEPHAIGIAPSPVSSPSASPLPALPARLPRARSQTPYVQWRAENVPSSPASEPGSEFDPSRSPSPALSASSNSSLEHEEPHSEFAAAIDEAFRSSPSPAPTPYAVVAPAPTSVEMQQACLQLCIALELHGHIDSALIPFSRLLIRSLPLSWDRARANASPHQKSLRPQPCKSPCSYTLSTSSCTLDHDNREMLLQL